MSLISLYFFFSSRRRHTRYWRDWSSDVCSSDLEEEHERGHGCEPHRDPPRTDRLELDPADLTARRARNEHLDRSEEHTSELQSRQYLVCRLLLEKKKNNLLIYMNYIIDILVFVV